MLIPSPKVATYDLKPEMSAYEVTDRLWKLIDSRQIRRDYPELCQLRHGRPHRRARGGGSRLWRPLMPASDRVV